MHKKRITKLLLAALMAAAPTVRAAMSTRDLVRRARFSALHRVADRVDPAKVKRTADRYVKRAYPGQKVKHRRTYRKTGEPEYLWFVLYDVGVRPAQEVEVRVDTRTWSAGEDLPV